MSESSKTLKEKALDILSFSNLPLSAGICLGVNLMFILIVIFKVSAIFTFSVVLLAATMAAVFYGLYKQGFPSEETPEAPAPENEEVEPRDLQIACSSLYDLLNDVVQALRNIIVLKDPQTVVCVLGALSALALLSQFIGDYVLLWILFDLSFLLASKPVAEGQFVSAIASKLNLKEYLNIVLGMIPRYEEKEGPTSSEEMPENRA